MAVLTIRAHKRFGVCRRVRLHRGHDEPLDGLLIELSLEGCRISNVNPDLFAVEQQVTVTIDNRPPFRAFVRWNHDGMIGLRLVQPLHHAELADLITHCRGVDEVPEARRA